MEIGRVPTVLEEQERVEREDELLREEEYRRKEEREKAAKPQPQRWVSSGRGEQFFLSIRFLITY